MQQPNQFHKMVGDHSLGFFSRGTAGEIFNKRGIIWLSAEAYFGITSPVHFCATRIFIPDRSCLDVPVGGEKNCSACNGLAQEFLREQQHLSRGFFPLITSQDTVTLKKRANRATDVHWKKKTPNCVFVVSDGLDANACNMLSPNVLRM